VIDPKIHNLIRDLKEDNESGANELVSNAIEIINAQLELIEEPDRNIEELIHKLSKEIIQTRSSMAPLINLIGFLISNIPTITKKQIGKRLKKYLEIREQKQKELEQVFISFLRGQKKKPLKIMLISYSSTIINILNKIKDLDLEFFVLESRPLLEGHRTAKLLSQRFPTNLIIDAAMSDFIEQSDLVLIGADSVLKDGSIINKVGTKTLTFLAKSRGIKVYVVGDSFKYNLRSHFCNDLVIERKPPEEIYKVKEEKRNLKIHNYYFDITPTNYVKGIISEFGVLIMHDFLKNVKKEIPIEWFKRYMD